MSITVVIPLYNKGPHIERTLQSVLSQTSLPAEIIVVDDGSTDGGGEIVKSINAPGLRLIRQENQGVSAARNRGIAEASGELIAFLDADDAWGFRFLEVILELRQKYPRAGAYATAYRVVDLRGGDLPLEFHVLPPTCQDGLIENYFAVALEFPVWTSAVAIPKKILAEIGGFQPTEVQGEDVDVWLRIALRYPVAWSREVLVVYYQDASNRAVGFKRWSNEPVISRTAREAIAAGLVPPDKVEDLREYASHFQVSAARDCLAQGKREIAVQLLDYAQGTKKFARQWWQWRILAALPGNWGPWLWKMKQLMKR